MAMTGTMNTPEPTDGFNFYEKPELRDSINNDPAYIALQQQLADLGASSGDLILEAGQAQSDYDDRIAQLERDKQASYEKFEGLYDDITSGYKSEKLDSEALLGEMRGVFEAEITNMSNAYNNQAAREAERVDALVANGALGGNAYRAYQAHTQTNRDLMSQATGQIAAVTLQATESLMSKGVEIAAINQAFYSQTMSTLASIANAQAQSSIGFSQLLVQAEIAGTETIQNIYGLQLNIMSQQNELYLNTRKLDNQLYVAELASVTSLEQARINKLQTSAINGIWLGTVDPVGNKYIKSPVDIRKRSTPRLASI